MTRDHDRNDINFPPEEVGMDRSATRATSQLSNKRRTTKVVLVDDSLDEMGIANSVIIRKRTLAWLCGVSAAILIGLGVWIFLLMDGLRHRDATIVDLQSRVKEVTDKLNKIEEEEKRTAEETRSAAEHLGASVKVVIQDMIDSIREIK